MEDIYYRPENQEHIFNEAKTKGQEQQQKENK